MTLTLLDPRPPDDDDVSLPAPAGWPTPPDRVVYHELLGEIINRITPHTEADPVAILTQLLVAFGAAVGRGSFFEVEATQHHPNEFMLLVGDSSRARKGSSWDHVRRLLAVVDPSLDPRIITGLSSGEGLIWSVRDPAAPDPGITDQRLLVIEPEFASVLKAANREISTLSPTLRSAWDGRPLAILTRTAPARATSAHVAVIGHITQHELRRHITSTELANGYLNRILLIACRRQRLLPDGGHHDPLAGTGLDRLLAAAVKHAKTVGRVSLDAHARERWHHAYRQLAAQPDNGIVSQITARAEAHIIRLALIYALTDGHRHINQQHLTAALALHDYAARSAAWALTGATGQPLAEQIHATLRAHPDGLTRSQISQTLKHNQPAGEIDHALHRPGRRRTRRAPPDPHRRPPGPALDRHQLSPAHRRTATATREWVASRAAHARNTAPPREPRHAPEASDQSEKAKPVSTRDAPPHDPDPTAFIAGRSTPERRPLPELLLLSYPTPRCRPTAAPPCRSSTALNTLHRCTRRSRGT